MLTEIEDLDMPAVEREMTALAGHLAAGSCRFLRLLAAFDTGGGWHGAGIRTCAQWLSWRCGLSTGAAREQLRVAHALTTLPEVRAAFASGQLSYSKARALTRVATPETETGLVATATACTASQLDRLCAGIARASTAAEVLEQSARASFTARWEADGSLRFSGRLAAADGATLLAALAAVRPDAVVPGEPAAVVTDENPAADTERPDAAGRAAHGDAAALVVIAEHALASPPPAVGPAQVRLVVHTSAEVFRAAETDRDTPAEAATVAVLDAGPGISLVPIAPATLRRLTCEALVEQDGDDPDTERPAHSEHRFASARQRRALLRRDGGCVFPGCPRRRALHAHHVLPWHRGGPTSMANLVLTCAHHHRLVHEGGWRLRRDDDGHWLAVRPDDSVLPAAPDCRGDVRRLPASHAAQIEPQTVGGTWAGDPLHLAYAVSVFAGRSAAEQCRRVKGSRLGESNSGPSHYE